MSSAAVSVLLCGAVAAPTAPLPAQAAVTSTGPQTITAYLVVDPGADQPRQSLVLASGVVYDVGTVEFGGEGEDGFNHDALHLRRGDVDLAAKADGESLSFDPRSCTGTATETGGFRATGSGRYEGLAGEGTWVNRATLIAPWSPQCSVEQAVAYVTFAARGHAVLSR